MLDLSNGKYFKDCNSCIGTNGHGQQTNSTKDGSVRSTVQETDKRMNSAWQWVWNDCLTLNSTQPRIIYSSSSSPTATRIIKLLLLTGLDRSHQSNSRRNSLNYYLFKNSQQCLHWIEALKDGSLSSDLETYTHGLISIITFFLRPQPTLWLSLYPFSLCVIHPKFSNVLFRTFDFVQRAVVGQWSIPA